ncbi:unnamed protein product [Cyprideis torosa]|uniref:PIH1 domain-containing protein 1 n=1 Tax=Cyprideis torosa TaxID=163714 RepID=A0A7R8ZIG9_9CRUS|nr:unnamed protein product [Cyprideis torosa]CAG0884764.1 unnamed protein product [Cyprideis torosa]
MSSPKKSGNFLDIDDSTLSKTLILESQRAVTSELEKLGLSSVGQPSSVSEDEPLLPQPNLPSKTIVPKPGFCVKTLVRKTKEKVFINICHSDEVPCPKPNLTEQELAAKIDTDEIDQYRIPMSIGEPHSEVDKSGKFCQAYDVIINSAFFEKVENEELFRIFLITVTIHSLDAKFDTELDTDDFVVLRNKKCHGTLVPQRVREILIEEVDESTAQSKSAKATSAKPRVKPLISLIEKEGKVIVGEVPLPLLVSPKSLVLDLGGDRILLASPEYLLDIYLPIDIVPERSHAQYHTERKMLYLTLPVAGM